MLSVILLAFTSAIGLRPARPLPSTGVALPMRVSSSKSSGHEARSVVQPHPLVGTWQVAQLTSVMMNGEFSTVERRGSLVVLAAGDSLVATLTFAGVDGLADGDTAKLVGLRTEGPVALVQAKTVTVVDAQRQTTTRTALSTYVMTVRADSLAAEVTVTVDGRTVQNPPGAIVGTRMSPERRTETKRSPTFSASVGTTRTSKGGHLTPKALMPNRALQLTSALRIARYARD
jgi:hypothetical protein